MRILTIVIAIAALVLVAVVLSARLGLFHLSDDRLKALYAQDGSRLDVVDNVPLRYKDEGSGYPVILLHGAFGNLNMWDDWAEILKSSYRVIRIDNPPEGLSGPDPSGLFGHDRNGELVGALANRLGLTRFAIGGTSRGAVVAYRYAAKNPEKVSHLILVNTPVLPQEAPPAPAQLRLARWINSLLGTYETRFYWREFLEFLFFDPSHVTDDLVDEYMAFNNRQGKEDRMQIVFSGGANRDVEEISGLIGSISAPTLIIASQTNAALALKDQRAMEDMFASTDPEFHLIDDGGHLLAIEKGQETGVIVKFFLDSNQRSFDGE